MKILRFPLGQLQTNCYLVINDDNTCLIIDPADEAPFILEEVQRRKLKIVGLLATHGHFDHVMAVGEIQLSFPDVTLYVSTKDLFLLARLKETAKHFLQYDPVILNPKKIASLKQGFANVGGFEFAIIETPGHTPGSCCFYFSEGYVFTGDTMFKDSIGEYDHSYSNKADLMQSIDYLLQLPEETVVYSGHGEETTISEVLNNH